MALTLQSVVDLARADLNDQDATDANRRYPDAEITKHVNHALLTMFNVAPFIWHGKYNTTYIPNGERVLTDAWPVDPKWLRPCADFVVALAESKDDEAVITQRAEMMFKRGATVMGK